MSSMVERVMQAIRVNVFQGIPREEAEVAARAAIAEMRNPTEAMWIAGRTVILDGNRNSMLDPALPYQAMIDSALSQPEGERE